MKMEEPLAKKLLLEAVQKQIQDIRLATVDLRESLKTDDDEQIKFVIATVRLVHDYLFTEAPRIAAQACLVKEYKH